MTAERILFYLFALSACGGAIAVVLSQNIVRMGFWLMVSLASTAALFFLLHADFVAATQLLIYVGGTLVVLIFGVMLTANKPQLRIRRSVGDLVIAGGIAFLLVATLAATTTGIDWDRLGAERLIVSAERHEDLLATFEARESSEPELLSIGFEPVQWGHSHVHADHAHPHGGGDQHAADFYRMEIPASLSPQTVSSLRKLLQSKGLKFSPRSPSGGTGRPIGFALLGMRVDRDLSADGNENEPTLQHLVPVGDGFYVQRLRQPQHLPGDKDLRASHNKDEHDGDKEQKSDNKEDSKARLVRSTGYLLPFELASIHLLVVLVGAAYLARAKRRIDDADAS